MIDFGGGGVNYQMQIVNTKLPNENLQTYQLHVTSVAFESKDDPTQMTKIVIYNYILYYIQKTIHSKLICTNVHS